MTLVRVSTGALADAKGQYASKYGMPSHAEGKEKRKQGKSQTT